MSDRGVVTGDFDDYITPGIWFYDGGQSVLHNPGDVVGNLEVVVGNSCIIQRITAYDRMFTRRKTGSNWTDWSSYATNTDLGNNISWDTTSIPGARIRIRHGFAIITFLDFTMSDTADTWNTLFSIPNQFRPDSIVYSTVTDNAGHVGRMYIDSGSCKVQYKTTSSGRHTGQIVYALATP